MQRYLYMKYVNLSTVFLSIHVFRSDVICACFFAVAPQGLQGLQGERQAATEDLQVRAPGAAGDRQRRALRARGGSLGRCARPGASEAAPDGGSVMTAMVGAKR